MTLPEDEKLRQALLHVGVKHLPPSPSTLQLVDVDGAAQATLTGIRQDLACHAVAADADPWPVEAGRMDAVMALDVTLTRGLLRRALAALRPGGRLIVLATAGEASADLLRTLETAGYVRILVEPALDDGRGVLLRGEKAHTTADTLARVEGVARRDDALTDFAAYPGRYVYLLVQQTPNKPVWALRPDERVTWRAAALEGDDGPVLLAFSGLPRAVGFMQPAVLKGQVAGVNKVGKFSRVTAQGWTARALLNPPADVLDVGGLTFVDVDPATAEAPDE